mmetsp:Transcript_3652/g.10027  ORF Transcript_3652/g.10027 Transcript_3652/m.10027 type:complete len:781 (-) Transcript_3652:104-2446(-)
MDAPQASHLSALRRPVSARWQCGPRRLELRQRFNTNELDGARIIEKYDADNSGALEVGELKALVQDYSQGNLVTQADVEYLLKVADANKDGVVSRGEVLHGLKAWFALRNLPKQADLALKEHGFGDGPLPTAEALRNFLVVANESQPVTLAEAQQVRSMALNLGATHEHVTFEQMRGAVAEWYLQIERDETAMADLGRKTLEGSLRKVAGFLRGEYELAPRTVRAGGCVLVLVGIIVPLLEIVVAQISASEQEYQCQHPHMNLKLRTTGCLTLAMTAAIACAVVAAAKDVQIAKLGFGGVAGILLVVLLTMEVYGMMDVNSSTSVRCGHVLWGMCYLVYCLFPFCTMVFVIFGMPCLFMQEYLHTKALDQRLTAGARRGLLRSSFDSSASSERGASGSGGMGPNIAVERLPEAEMWRCGEQRLALRKQFNAKEIDASKLMRKYDKDSSGVLEADELQQLLSDCNGHKPVSPEDLEYVLRVSDLDRDECISKDEVLYGVRVWYAFSHMPKAVGEAFTKHNVHDGPMLPLESMAEFLATLNESQPVTDEEVAYVRTVGMALGGSEEHVTVGQMRRAVATWYLHIKRPETSRSDLMRKSFSDLQHKLANVKEHARRAYHGEIDYHSTSSLAFVGTAVFIVLVQPLLELLVASGFPSTHTCEYPELSTKLWWTGIVTLSVAVGAAGCGFAAVSEKLSLLAKKIVYVAFALLSTLFMTMECFGLMYSLSSTVTRCGLVLWTFCHFTYVMLPLLTLFAICCGIPGLFFVEYFDNSSVDGGLDGFEA